jgi:hypothetical protein
MLHTRVLKVKAGLWVKYRGLAHLECVILVSGYQHPLVCLLANEALLLTLLKSHCKLTLPAGLVVAAVTNSIVVYVFGTDYAGRV